MPHNQVVDRILPTIVETSAFTRRAEKLLTADEYEELTMYLSTYHHAGDEIPGTGGVRKLRFAARGRGRSGGARIIYYFYDDENPLYAIFLFGKNEQVDLTQLQKKEATLFAASIKAAAKAERKSR
jgi:hypothetical protein